MDKKLDSFTGKISPGKYYGKIEIRYSTSPGKESFLGEIIIQKKYWGKFELAIHTEDMSPRKYRQ